MKKALSRACAAEFLTENGYPTAKGTLQKLASVGGGPAYQIYGNKALYQPDVLLAWAQSRLSQPRVNTSESQEAAANA